MDGNDFYEVGTSDFCRNFPRKPIKILSRDNLYEHLDQVFSAAARCVLIEGEPQCGKSEFLAGYMRRNPQNAIGVFLSPGDPYFYSPEYARIVLGEQISWLINGGSGNFESLDEATYKGMLYKLQKLARQRPITFVVDGLAERSAPENRLKSDFLALLPFGQQDFRFLVSGPSDLESDLKSRCKSFKSVPLIQIAQEEAVQLFSDMPELSGKDILDIRKFCAGSIGRLTKLKSIIQGSNTSLDEVLTNRNGQLEDLMEMEWSALEGSDAQKRLIAFLCFSNRPLSIEQLASFSKSNEGEARINLEKSPFIEQEASTGHLSIRSNSQRSFLRKKLKEYELETQTALLVELLDSPDSAAADRYLPAQLMQVGRYDDLVSRLDTAYFCRLLNNEKSLRVLRANFDLGLKAAKHLGDDALVSKFAMWKSAVGGISLSVGSQSRIETLVTMGQAEEAIELSLAAPTHEERLKHLAATAKTLFDERKIIPNSVRTEIASLIDSASVETLGEMAITIACDLIAVDIDAAVKLFNQANTFRKKEKTATAAIDSDKQGGRATSETEVAGDDSLEIRVSERHHKRFSQALGRLVDRTAADKLCSQARESEDHSSYLIFLKAWIGRRRDDPRAHEVANSAIDLMLKDLSRAPRIEDLRAIAGVLPHIEDGADAEKLYRRIQALVSTELFLGNSVEAVRLRMLLLETQYRVSKPDAELAMLDILLEAETLEDIGTRTACLSWMLFALKSFSDWELLETKTSLISHTTAELMKSIDLLLQSSADQYSAVKTAVPALARADVKLAMQVCGSLNTETRRDHAYSTLLSELFILMKYEADPGEVLTCVSHIQDEGLRSTSILNGLSTVVDHLKAKRSHSCNDGVVNLWRNLRLDNYRFMGLRYALQISLHTGSSKLETFKEEILKCWKANEIDWVRWELGYSLVRDTYLYDRDFAEEWLARVADEEATFRSPSESVNDVLKLIASLAVRAYSYLAPANFEPSEEFSSLEHLISTMAVPDERLLMWCELGIRLYYAGKIEFSKHICRSYVEQLLPAARSQPDGARAFADQLTLGHAAPFIYLTHESTGQFAVDKISCPSRRDAAISEICFTLLRRVASTDAFKDPGPEGYELDAQTATSIVALMGKMSSDYVFFSVLNAVADSLSSRKNERKIRRVQVAELLGLIEAIARRILPDPRNISHAGFLISSLAVLNRARQNVGIPVPQKDWVALYSEARGLQNVSDRAVVTAFVGVGARARSGVIPNDWLERIREDVAAAPTVLDQIDRHAWLAEILEDLDKKESLSFARLGMQLTKFAGADANLYDRKKRLLDVVFNIDPELADSFIELSDSDRARKNDRAALEARLKLQRLQKEVATNPDKFNLSGESDKDIAELSMQNLSKLNANRLVPRDVEEFAQLSVRAQGLPFEDAYCVWSWMVENAIRKGGANSKGDKVVRNAFGAALRAGELVVSLLHGSVRALNASGHIRTGLVRPGDRDDAFALITDWAKSVDGSPITISDPYFGPDDVDFLFELVKAAPKSDFRVLTGRRNLRSVVADGNFEASFISAWKSVCEDVACDVEIFVIGVNADGDHPIHDRWILGGESGLRLGTSAKSLGNYRVSEIGKIDRDEVADRLELIGGFLERRTRTWDGNRVNVLSFGLF